MVDKTGWPEGVGEDTFITLRMAASMFFGGPGNISAESLRTEVARGRLVVFKIGGKCFTTPAEMIAMADRCRVEPVRQVELPPRQKAPDRSIAYHSAMQAVADLKARVTEQRRIEKERQKESDRATRRAIEAMK